MEFRIGAAVCAGVLVLTVGVFLVFPGLKPSWIKVSAGKGQGQTVDSRFLSIRPTSWSPPPTPAEASFKRGVEHLGKEKWDLAVEAFNDVLRHEPESADAYYNRGVARYNQDQDDEAASDFEAALRLEPKHVEALLARATILTDRKQFELALADLDAAIRIAPDNADAFCTRGKLREDSGEYRLALADYQEGARLAPEDPVVLNCLAWLLATAPEAALRDGKLALKVALRAVEIDEAQEWDSIDTLGAAFAEIGRFPDAVRCQSEALRLAPPEVQDQLKARLKLYQGNNAFRLPGKVQ
jgi:tetratricopeptide (TPR) repeat protein